jgi:hypothetical protein
MNGDENSRDKPAFEPSREEFGEALQHAQTIYDFVVTPDPREQDQVDNEGGLRNP